MILFAGLFSFAGVSPSSQAAFAESAKKLTPELALKRRIPGEVRLSPDRRRVAFTETEPVGGSEQNRDIWVYNLETGEARRFTTSEKVDRYPRWSPDGAQLAFLSSRADKAQIYRIRMDGGEAEALTESKTSVQSLEWSPSGKLIAFAAEEPKTDREEEKEKEKDDARGFIGPAAGCPVPRPRPHADRSGSFSSGGAGGRGAFAVGGSGPWRAHREVLGSIQRLGPTLDGGYMAAWAVTQTDRFRASLSGAPMTDLEVEYGTETASINAYDTWFMGTPYDNQELFRDRSPMTHVSRAKTSTLILCGDNDVIDPPGQCQQFYRGLRRMGVDASYVRYPREGHGIRERMHRLDLLRRVVSWFEEKLLGPTPGS